MPLELKPTQKFNQNVYAKLEDTFFPLNDVRQQLRQLNSIFHYKTAMRCYSASLRSINQVAKLYNETDTYNDFDIIQKYMLIAQSASFEDRTKRDKYVFEKLDTIVLYFEEELPLTNFLSELSVRLENLQNAKIQIKVVELNSPTKTDFPERYPNTKHFYEFLKNLKNQPAILNELSAMTPNTVLSQLPLFSKFVKDLAISNDFIDIILKIVSSKSIYDPKEFLENATTH